MIVQSIRDRRPAREYTRAVACLWVQEIDPGSEAFVHRRAPSGSAEIVCAIGSTPRVLGPQTGPLEDLLTAGSVLVGVRLRAEAAAAVLGLPASELTDEAIELDELWRGTGDRLGETLADAATPDGAARALEAAVASRANAPDPVVGEALRRLLEGETLASVAASLFISERQLRRRCETAAGLAPKTLHRILRFQRFLALAWHAERPTAELARLAAEAGYADQAHLTREAARLEGRSPRVFLAESEEHCCSGHDHSASYGPQLRTSAREMAGR
jgi:AraC-like DNA-binding protein